MKDAKYIKCSLQAVHFMWFMFKKKLLETCHPSTGYLFVQPYQTKAKTNLVVYKRATVNMIVTQALKISTYTLCTYKVWLYSFPKVNR